MMNYTEFLELQENTKLNEGREGIVQLLGANNYEVFLPNGKLFQSYSSLVALKTLDKLYVTEEWDSSATTLKFFKKSMRLEDKTKAQIQKDIDNDLIEVVSEKELRELALK